MLRSLDLKDFNVFSRCLECNTRLEDVDKEAVFDALDTIGGCLGAARRISAGIVFHRERLSGALAEGHATATDLADHLVGRGVPFRTAHEQAGRAVREAEKLGISLADLPPDVLSTACPDAGTDVAAFLSAERSVRSRRSAGGPAPEAVSTQIGLAEREIEAARAWLGRRQAPPIYRAHREGKLSDGEIT